MYCTYCGQEINGNAKFCMFCGQKNLSLDAQTVKNDTTFKSETDPLESTPNYINSEDRSDFKDIESIITNNELKNSILRIFYYLSHITWVLGFIMFFSNFIIPSHRDVESLKASGIGVVLFIIGIIGLIIMRKKLKVSRRNNNSMPDESIYIPAKNRYAEFREEQTEVFKYNTNTVQDSNLSPIKTKESINNNDSNADIVKIESTLNDGPTKSTRKSLSRNIITGVLVVSLFILTGILLHISNNPDPKENLIDSHQEAAVILSDYETSLGFSSTVSDILNEFIIIDTIADESYYMEDGSNTIIGHKFFLFAFADGNSIVYALDKTNGLLYETYEEWENDEPLLILIKVY